MNKENLKNNKTKICKIICTIIAIIAIVIFIVFKPKYELNKAINYLKYGKYKEAYEYIENRNNEENKVIVKELITESFSDRAGNGIKKIGDIATESNKIVNKTNLNNIDYTLDDKLNIDVMALDSYISLENEISKDMIIEELSDTYDLYFKDIKYVRENFYDVLNHINDEQFVNNVNELATDMTKISNDFISTANNHNYNPKTQDLYEKIKKYIVKN